MTNEADGKLVAMFAGSNKCRTCKDHPVLETHPQRGFSISCLTCKEEGNHNFVAGPEVEALVHTWNRQQRT